MRVTGALTQLLTCAKVRKTKTLRCNKDAASNAVAAEMEIKTNAAPIQSVIPSAYFSETPSSSFVYMPGVIKKLTTLPMREIVRVHPNA